MSSIRFSVGLMACLTLLFSSLLSFSAYSQAAKTTLERKPHQGYSKMKIRIDIEGLDQPLFAMLQASPATQDFINQLPLSLVLNDYASTEKIADLPQKLSMLNVPRGYAGQSGDITYYAPWGNIAIFYKDSTIGSANGLIFLGKMKSLPKEFTQMKKLNVLITQVK